MRTSSEQNGASEWDPGQIDIPGATFDDPDAFAPQAHIQVADAPGWMAGIADLPKFDRYPGGAE